MFALGLVVTSAYERAQMKGIADTGSLFIEGVLTPHAYELLDQPDAVGDLSAEIGEIVAATTASRHFEAINIWNVNGQLLFRSRPYEKLEVHDSGDLDRALKGEVVAALEQDSVAGEAPVDPPYIEVYAPIFSPGSNKVVGAGEIYIRAEEMLSDRRRTETALWLAVAIAAIALAGLTGIVTMQRRKIISHYAALARSSATNLSLLKRADAARAAAVQGNEALLQEIGSALHDGPLQMLTLAALSNDADANRNHGAGASTAILREAITQLRRISAGMFLPEIEGLSAGEAVELAVARHDTLTGARPDLAIGALPMEVPLPIRTCLYRVVQEGLANAYRHAGSHSAVTVGYDRRADRISVEIVNAAPVNRGLPRAHGNEDDDPSRPRLGLDALRHRIAALGGELTITGRPDGGAVLRAELPLMRDGSAIDPS